MTPGNTPPSSNADKMKMKVLVYMVLALIMLLAAILVPVFTDAEPNQTMLGIVLLGVVVLIYEVVTIPKGVPSGSPSQQQSRPQGRPPAKSNKPAGKPQKSGGKKPAAKAPRKKPARVVVEDQEQHEDIEIDEDADETPVKKRADGKIRLPADEVKKEIESRRIISYPANISGGKYGDCFLVIDRNTILKVRTLLARSCRMCKNRDNCWEKYQDVMDYDSFMNNFECLEEGMDIIADEEETAVEQVTLVDEPQIVEDYGVDYEEYGDEIAVDEEFEEGDAEEDDGGDEEDAWE